MLSLFRKRVKGEKGFTLIELLVVIIIAILAATPSRPSWVSALRPGYAAKSLVQRHDAIESAYVDLRTFDPAEMTLMFC